MNGMRRRTTATSAAVLLAVSGFGLAGCSGDGDTTVVTDDATMALEQDDEKIEITSSEGSLTINGESDGELPAGWPAAVPVPSGGTVLSGLAMTGSDQEGWTASLSYPDSSTAEISDEVKSLLIGQGFEAASEVVMGDGSMNAFTGNGFAITAMVGQEDTGATLVMTVAVDG